MRLGRGHNRLNDRLQWKTKLAPSPTCNCGLKNQTAEHVLQRYPLLQTARQTVRPTVVPLHNKVRGSEENLEKTAPWGGDVAQLVERRTGTPLTQVRLPGAARDFSPKVRFQCKHFYGVRTLPCATAGIYICVHVQDPVVHVKSSADYRNTKKHSA